MSRAPNGNGYTNGANPAVGMNGAAMFSQTQLGTMSRAERFEDEKRRIIESCFAKLDQNGQLAESYITHIRVQEDAMYPTTPAPPDGNPDNKKPRVIIIAVRSTGRVRMHKGRENNNGSFSIGKTWNLEELAVIESYSNSAAPPLNDQEAQYRAWAGNFGFTVTITKPYYWQAGTAKEKEFFIASAVKIYRKYTKGQVPELRGFDEAQKASMLGAMPDKPASPPQAPARLASRGRDPNPAPTPEPPRPPFAQADSTNSSSNGSRYRSPGGDENEMAGSRSQSPAPYAPDGNVPKPFAGNDAARAYSPVRAHWNPDPRPSNASTQSSTTGLRSPPPPAIRVPSPQSSLSQMRSESPANASIASGRDITPSASPFPQRKESAPSVGGTSDRQIPMSPMNGSFAQPSLQTSQRGRDSPALPPLETPPLFGKSNSNQQKPPPSPAPRTGESSLSSAGIGDPTAFASVSGYMGPEQSVAGATVSGISQSSPPTPPRSRRRPTLETTLSESQVEGLRPAPLNTQSSRGLNEGISPTTPEPPKIDTTMRNSDSNLPLPGVGSRGALAPSPLASPALGPREELGEDAARKAEEEEYRPGLGPMIKRKAVAERLRQVAEAASSFKPRPGGAAEKILKAKAEREGTAAPDGITGVVPRPLGRFGSKNEDLAVKRSVGPPPQVDVSAAMADGKRAVELHDDTPQPQTPLPRSPFPGEEDRDKLEQRQARQIIKVKRRSATQERYLDYLGVDRSLLADKCLDFEFMLYDFGWKNAALSPKALTDMETDIRREQNRMEAGGWLTAPAHETNARQRRENDVLSLLDKAIQECDEMDGLLTIYNVELSSLNEDIAYIEAQSQGLQVQAANQRNLQSELTNLVQTLSMDRRSLESIRNGDLSSPRGIDEVEQCLKKLYTAIITIDPNLRTQPSGRPQSRNGINEGNELSSMSAVRQKQDAYLHQSELFCQRLAQHLDYLFTTSFNTAKSQALVPSTGSAGGMRLNLEAYINARKGMWVYGPLILYMKEINWPSWQSLIKTYGLRARPLYADAFGQNVASWKRVARKPTGEEGEILFTAQEKEEVPEGRGIASSARKLTVKRSQTLAKTLRKASDERPGSAASDGRNTGGMHFCEIFAGAVDEMAPLISQEQNFVVDLFHTTSLETADFMDVVAINPPDQRHGTNLAERKPMDPNRELAKQVTNVTDDIFGFFTNELSKLLDWSVSVDPIQGVGVMACLSRHSYYLQDGNQEFLVQLADTLMARLQNLFAKFVDDQIRAIEETKVRVKKRKGVIGFMRIFPHFAAAVENTFSLVAGADYDQDADCMAEVRKRVDEAYTRINRAMFDSLKVIAKESPHSAAVAAARAATDDPEDKAMLNYHVLLIENMNHYLEEVDDGSRRGVLSEWKGRAEMERREALDNYVGAVLRRPLGKLLEFLDALSAVQTSLPPNTPPTNITSRPTFSRKSARSVLSQYDPKEIRRGIDHLRSRVEKHFGVGDDEAICRALVAMVSKECEKAYEGVIQRVEDVLVEFYPNLEGEKNVELEFGRGDVMNAFRR